MNIWISSNFDRIPPPTPELSALERLNKLMYNVVKTLAPSVLIGSSSSLQKTLTHSKSPISSKFCQIGLRAAELAALERLEKNTYIDL